MRSKFLTIFILSIIILSSPGTSLAASGTYSKRTESFFKAATYVYWLGTGDLANNRITCMPNEVKIIYVNVDARWGAQAAYDGGLKGYKYYPDGYCEIQINKKYKETRAIQCLNFVHEYGHLIGYRHDHVNSKSVMYDGYKSEKDPDKFYELLKRWRKNIFAKTICDSSKIRG